MLPDFTDYSIVAIFAVFAATSIIILLTGIKLTNLADRFADQSGLGEAATGAVFLGALTSLAGSVTSITAAHQGHAELAISNAIGGIAAQTMFFVLADFTYRRANLEHAVASLPNIITGTVLIILLALLLAAALTPEVTIFGIHPMSPALIMVYIMGVTASQRARNRPAWLPDRTDETREDIPEEPELGGKSLLKTCALLVILGLVVGVCGVLIAETGLAIAERTGVREGLIGLLLTSVATSTPELVTTIVAIRRGALTLALSGILGGNAFDVLFSSMSDVAYRSGSIYHAIAPDQIFLIILSILMTAVLLLGLLMRERAGPANIGFEGLALILLYVSGVGILVWGY